MRTQLRPHALFALSLMLAAGLLNQTAHAGKLYLMGGGYSDTNTDLFVNGLRKATGRDASFTPNINSTANCGTDWATTSCPRIVVITAASANAATGVDAFLNDLGSGSSLKRGYYNLFQTHGFSPKHVNTHIDNYATGSYSSANVALINQADVVFFSGGDQAKIARSLFKDDGSDTPVAAAIRTRWNGGAGSLVLAGDSAGNHFMNATMHGVGISYGYLYFGADLPSPTPIASYATFGDTRDGTAALRYYDNGGTMKGLGALPTTLLSDTHFDSRSGRLGRLAAAMRDLNIKLGLGVDENTGVLVDTATNTAKVFGGGTLIVVDSNAATVQAATTFKVTNLRVSLLTAGDTFNTSTRTVTSTKSLISTRYYSGYYDSANIFGALETSKSLTRVVDQSGSYNLGSAPRPVYSSGPNYPTSAPTLKVRFTRDASTKGWYSGGKYSVEKVKVDFE
jgi:cyanophycinase